jgi:hypothetical protein
MRKLRKERGLKGCRREVSADFGEFGSPIVLEEFIGSVETEGVNKDVMYRISVDVARL